MASKPPPSARAGPGTPPATASQGPLAALIGIVAAGLATASVMTWEGKANDPYLDIVGIPTVCFGDTAEVNMRQRQSDAQCAVRLERQLVAHAKPVLACTPRLKALATRGQPGPLAAAVSLAYNIGPAAYCRSTVDRRFDAGDVRGGCAAMLAWNRAGGKIVRGLVRRRAAERAICLEGLK